MREGTYVARMKRIFFNINKIFNKKPEKIEYFTESSFSNCTSLTFGAFNSFINKNNSKEKKNESA